MIEPEAVIDPEAAPAAPRNSRRRRALIAGVTALFVVAGGIALAAGGGRSEPEPLALMAGGIAGDGSAGRAEAMSTPAPAIGAPADSRLTYYGGWGLRFEVAGDLPDLPDQAPAWRATGPALDRDAVARIAGALGVTGTPVPRDGGWFVESGEWTLSAFPGDTWSINVFRGRDAGPVDAATAGDETPTGPALSPAEAEQRVRDLLDRMGAPAGSWRFDTTETELGVRWACAAPAPAISPEELKRLEAAKLRQLEPPNAGTTGTTLATPADKPLPGGTMASCPPPPPPVKGLTVALYPLLEGRRADWPVWNVTLRSDGRIEGLYGSWLTFERGDSYKLRGVDAALTELQSPAEPLYGDVAEGNAVPTTTVDAPAFGAPAVSAPAVGLPAIEPAPAPQVVTITGVEPGLIQATVFEDGKARLHLVPSYRFLGRFDNGTPWETSVIALHPDAIAPPPDFPVGDDVRSGGGATGVGKAVPPIPAGVEPAVVSDPDPAR